MFRNRSFKLKSLCDSSSWETLADMFQFIVSNKKQIADTFDSAVYDLNFNEPMNVIRIECDRRNSEVQELSSYVNKINDLFAEDNDKIIVDFKVCEIPARYRKRVYFYHEWTVKEAI